MPDPSRRQALQLMSGCATVACWPRAARAQAAPEFSADAARNDLRVLKRALTELHPGLYRYATPAQIDAEFAAADAAVAGGASRAQMFLLASRIAAAVCCGHTWASPYNQRDDVVRALFERTDKLPLTLRVVEGRWLVTGSSDAGVPAGAELLAIDGRPMAQVTAALLPLLRADGRHEGAQGKRLSQLDSGPNGGAMDRLFPLLFPPTGGRWRIGFRSGADDGAPPREVEVAATTVAARERSLPPPATAWRHRVDGDTVTLTLPTFAFWNSSFKPLDELRQRFAEWRDRPFLIIDQRDNEGGDDAIGRALLGLLLRAPHQQAGYRVESAYERVPYDLARYLDTWDFGFFDRTGKVSRGSGRNWLLSENPGRRIEPAAEPYRGRAVLMVGPQNSSAGYLLARDAKDSGAATLLGRTTGGNRRGLSGGQLCWINLPASGVGVDIPLVAAFAPAGTPATGVQPDLAVAPRWRDARAGIDTEMQAALALVAGWRRGRPA